MGAPKRRQSTVFKIMIAQLLARPRRVFVALALLCVALLAFAVVYLQHVVGLDPCPMCIVQREAFIALALCCTLAAISRRRAFWLLWGGLGIIAAAFGAFTAARQSWLQWNPPEFATCGRDLYGIIESFPLGRAIPLIFRGSGECSAIDWTFLGLTIANWAFLGFVGVAIALVTVLAQSRHSATQQLS